MSSSGTILFVSAIAGAGALFATKPSQTDMHRHINDLILGAIYDGNDLSDGVMKYTCTKNPEKCVQLVKTTMGVSVSIEDNLFWRSASISSAQDNTEIRCLGVLNNLYCPNFLNDAEEEKKEEITQSAKLDIKDVVCIRNKQSGKFSYKYRWENGNKWESTTVKPGWEWWHSNTGNQKFYIRFDQSIENGYDEKEYYLETYKSTEQCEGAKIYEAYSTGLKFDLRYIN